MLPVLPPEASMSLPFTVEQFYGVFRDYNTTPFRSLFPRRWAENRCEREAILSGGTNKLAYSGTSVKVWLVPAVRRPTSTANTKPADRPRR
jgi:hypothetical protein